jgi:hypothetical protein
MHGEQCAHRHASRMLLLMRSLLLLSRLRLHGAVALCWEVAGCALLQAFCDSGDYGGATAVEARQREAGDPR